MRVVRCDLEIQLKSSNIKHKTTEKNRTKKGKRRKIDDNKEMLLKITHNTKTL
jgi:hypothetical protein